MHGVISLPDMTSCDGCNSVIICIIATDAMPLENTEGQQRHQYPSSLSINKTFDCHSDKLNSTTVYFVCFVDLILYIPVNNLSVMWGRVFLG